MSVSVPLERLQQAAAEYDGGYLVTVGEDSRPHAVYVAPVWEEGALVAEIGTRSAANATLHPEVALVYPPRVLGGYSLIMDGTATVAPGDGKRGVRVVPTKAMLHRPATAPDPARACADDCIPILGGRAER